MSMKFNDVYNPTVAEIRLWAYSDQLWPEEDWDLYLVWKDELLLYLELATDHKCNKQDFFQYLLYFIVAKQVRPLKDPDEVRILLKKYLDQSNSFKHGVVRNWRNELEVLQREISSFSYHKWIENGLIYQKDYLPPKLH